MADTPDTIPLLGFGLANYRSFDSEGFVLRDVKKVNVFIGKNNSGKSNILRAINVLRQVNTAVPSFKALDWLVDGHRQQEVPFVASAVLPANLLLEKVPPRLLREYQQKAGDTVTIRWNLRTGFIDGPHPFDVMDLAWLQQCFQPLTNMQVSGQWPGQKDQYYPHVGSALRPLPGGEGEPFG
jgi:hypothetical protein